MGVANPLPPTTRTVTGRTRVLSDRRVNRVVNWRRLADQPHGSRLRLVLPLELHRLEARPVIPASLVAAFICNAERFQSRPQSRPASRASLSSALKSATMRHEKCV